jgi:hypothetical protein
MKQHSLATRAQRAQICDFSAISDLLSGQETDKTGLCRDRATVVESVDFYVMQCSIINS